MRDTQAQREALELKLKELESEHTQTELSKSEAARLRSLLQEKDKRLRDLEDRTRELHEERRKANEWQKKESLIRREIEHVKREKVELQRRMSENLKQHLEELKERKLEIAGLKRERARLEQDTNHLTARTERDTKLLQQKTEQIAAMQRKLREAQKLTGHSRALSEREKKQRLELEKLATALEKREEELLDLRRVLAKKEEAIARRNKLVEKLEKLKNTEESELMEQNQGMTIKELVPEATSEEIKELEQRLEAVNSEILYRDKQCSQVLLKEDSAQHDEEQVVLGFTNVEQAKEVCRVLMQMLVEAKRELREKKLESERLHDQFVNQDKAVKFERRRTETLLTASSAASPTKPSNPSGSFNPTIGNAFDVSNIILQTPEKSNQQDQQLRGGSSFVDSAARLKTIETKLRLLRVDGESTSPPPPPPPKVPISLITSDSTTTISSNNNSSTSNLGVPALPPRKQKDVIERLTSPSAWTGTQKYGRRTSLPANVSKFNHREEGEELMDEIRVSKRRSHRMSVRPIPMIREISQDSLSTSPGKSQSTLLPSKLDEPAPPEPQSSPERQKSVGSHESYMRPTESYKNKQFLDAEARRLSSTARSGRGNPSPTRPLFAAVSTNLAGFLSVPGKENSSFRSAYREERKKRRRDKEDKAKEEKIKAEI